MEGEKLSEVSMSGEIGELAKALAMAQAEIRGAVADSQNPFFKSSYADLASVWDACRAPLSKNCLSVIQVPTNDNGRVVLLSILAHASGQWISGKLSVKPKADDPQGIGSAITYARRYALAALVGVATIDDDGEGAQGRKADGPSPAALAAQKKADAQAQKKADTQAPVEQSTPAHVSQIRARAIGFGIMGGDDQIVEFAKHQGIECAGLYSLDPASVEKLLAAMAVQSSADAHAEKVANNARPNDVAPLTPGQRMAAAYNAGKNAGLDDIEWKKICALVEVTKGCRDQTKIAALESEISAWITIHGKVQS